MLIDGHKLEWEWVTNHYDIHLSGYGRVDGILYRIRDRASPWGNWFNSAHDDEKDEGPDNPVYATHYADDYEAERIGLFGWLLYRLHRFAFEQCVGKHWSYRGGKRLARGAKFTPGRKQKLYYKIRGLFPRKSKQ